MKLLWGQFRDLVKSNKFQFLVSHALSNTVQVKDALSADLDDIYDYLEDELPEVRLRDVLDAFQRRIAAYSKAESRRGIDAVNGLMLDISEERQRFQGELFVRRNVELIRGLTEDQRKRIGDSVLKGVQEGWSLRDVMRDIAAAVDISENRARLIARDQTSSYNAALNQERMVANGVGKFIWSTAGDERVRASHAELEGREFSWDNLPTVDGEEGVAPGVPINCRCVAIATVD